MKVFRFLMFALAAIGVAACSNDDDNTVVNSKEQPLPLNITVSEKPLHNPDAPAQAPATRTEVTTTPTLSEFTLDYQYMRGEELQHGFNNAKKDESGHWSAGTWPDGAGDDIEVKWYAHTDGTMPQDESYINFTVDEQTNNQKDLLVATASGTKTGTGGNLSFTFDHACTALRFYVKKSTNLDDYTLTVTSIKICNVVKNGNYNFDSKSWTLGTNLTEYTLYSSTTAMTLNSADWILLNANENDYLFVIPQTLTPWDKTTATINTQTYFKIDCIVKDNSNNINAFEGTTYIPFAATLTAGYQNDVKINIGKNSLYKAW